MDKGYLRKADFITGLVLIGGGAFVAVAGWGMPRSARLDPVLAAVASPGLLPLSCGVLLIVMGCYLSIKAARSGGIMAWSDLSYAARRVASPDAMRMAIVTLLLAVFIFGFIGRMPYWAATAAYMTILVYYLRRGALWQTLLLAAAVAGVIHLIFVELVRIPLP